jgi:Zn-finger domain-containing protein
MKIITIFIYLAVSILLFFFNWSLFTASLELDLGFGLYKTLPFFVLQIFGGIVLAVYMIWDRMKDLKREVVISGLQKKVLELEKNSEIEILKKNAESKQTIKIIEQKP